MRDRHLTLHRSRHIKGRNLTCISYWCGQDNPVLRKEAMRMMLIWVEEKFAEVKTMVAWADMLGHPWRELTVSELVGLYNDRQRNN